MNATLHTFPTMYKQCTTRKRNIIFGISVEYAYTIDQKLYLFALHLKLRIMKTYLPNFAVMSKKNISRHTTKIVKEAQNGRGKLLVDCL